jgi:ferredoxin
MIYYFSGTGNSRYVAEQLGKELTEEVAFMSLENAGELRGNSIGLVFPVYSWGVPPIVLDFIAKFPQNLLDEARRRGTPLWAVMTCGDEVALAPEMLEKALEKRGVYSESVWSVIMPNNYVLLPGFDVDPKDVEQEKLKAAPARISEIAEGIRKHRLVVDVTRGKKGWLKTKTVYPLFKKWGISPKRWRSTEACVGCGICARSCPVGNIRMNEETRRPEWGDNCTSCVGCFHSCPRHAVEYGNMTKSKGQYYLKN